MKRILVVTTLALAAMTACDRAKQPTTPPTPRTAVPSQTPSTAPQGGPTTRDSMGVLQDIEHARQGKTGGAVPGTDVVGGTSLDPNGEKTTK